MTNQPAHPIKHLIITRPKGQAKSLMDKISAVVDGSITLKHCPLLQISPVKFELPDLKNLNGMIFISSNAAQYFLKNISLPKVKLLAVGENTAAEVEALSGQKVIFPEQMNAEGLLALAQLKNISGQNWLIVKGEDGRPLIYEELLKRGASVTEVDVYQRKLPDFEQQQLVIQANLAETVWLITSAEALNHLFRILGLAEKSEHQIKVIISSDRLAVLAKQKGFVIVAQSVGASEKQLLECIHYLIQQQKTQ